VATEPTEARVATQIQKIRVNEGFSIRGLAEKAGVSANAVSLIERGTNSPTVATLRRLADALEVPITAFFQPQAQELTVLVRRGQGVTYESQGLQVESLGAGALGQQLEAFSITVDPGAGNSDDPISHSGEEFARCLEGQIEYLVGGRSYHLEPGDSLLFDSSQPHALQNVSEAPAKVLVLFSAGEEQHIARRQHREI
jgi:transcriptional regulator with XRE-family HTH domain